MGSSSKKYKEKSEGRKRHHRNVSEDREQQPREKRHKHKKHHHKEKKRDKHQHHVKTYEYESADSDVVEISPERIVPTPRSVPTPRAILTPRVIPTPRAIPPPPPPQQQTYEKSPENARGSKSSQDSLSISETNKLRARLGLKPLQIGTESVKADGKKDDGKKKDDLGEFYHKPASNLAATAKQEKIKNKLNEHRDKRHIAHKLSKVKLLADSDEDEDVKKWVEKNRKIQEAKKAADQRAKMLEELDAQFGVSDVIEHEEREKRRKQYTERNLRGLQVDHDVDTFGEGSTVILTLKDKGILDEDADDVLVNVNMLDNERYKKSNENKKKKLVYNPYDIEEFDEFGHPKEKVLLEKYDEEIDGEKRSGFHIGYDNAVERKQAHLQSIKEKLENKRLENLDTSTLKLASEYYNESELAKFKKPKKKLRKIRAKGKVFSADDLEAANNTGIEDIGTRRPKKEDLHLDIDDIPSYNYNGNDMKFEEKDDLLERALHKARKMKQRETMVQDLMSNVIANLKPEIKEEPVDTGNIILNSTAEFCRTLGDIPTYGRAGNRDETEDMLEFDKDQMENSDDSDDCQIIEPKAGTWNSVDPNHRQITEVNKPNTDVPILDEEPDVGSGVGAALKLAMSKGYLDKEESNRPSNSRLAYLQAKHYSIEDKNYGEESERGGRGQHHRYAGPVQDFKEKDTFKPNVKLEYIDDDGHVLNSKEAFRYLSHKFHGKGPGKNKIEKRIKKSQQEGLMKKMSSTDTPLGTLNMLQAKQKEMQSPYIVLSGGKTHSTTISKTRR